MKLKKKHHKYIILGISIAAVIVLAAGGYFYFQTQKKQASDQNSGKSVTPQTDDSKNDSAKTDNSQKSTTAAPIQTKPSTTNTTAPVSLGNLADVSLTAYLYNQPSVAPDGATSMPAGSITPYFYMSSGTFTIQKMVNGAWQDVITNQSYPGHGGIAAWFDGPTEDSISYRVLGIQNGKPVSASKTFVIKRSDLSSGVHTYN